MGWGLFGLGIGFASSQLTNVILSDISAEKSGVASGTNSTVRQVGAALGVAVIGSVFASLTVSKTIDAVRATTLPASLRATVASTIHAQGAAFTVPRGTAPTDAATLSHALATGLTDATRPALIVAAGFVTVGAFLSLLIPRHPSRGGEAAVPVAEAFASLEPIEEDRVLVDEREPA